MNNLKDKSITELQALAYQNIVQIQAFQRGLEIIEAELALRAKEIKVDEVKEVGEFVTENGTSIKGK